MIERERMHNVKGSQEEYSQRISLKGGIKIWQNQRRTSNAKIWSSEIKAKSQKAKKFSVLLS